MMTHHLAILAIALIVVLFVVTIGLLVGRERDRRERANLRGALFDHLMELTNQAAQERSEMLDRIQANTLDSYAANAEARRNAAERREREKAERIEERAPGPGFDPAPDLPPEVVAAAQNAFTGLDG